MNKVDELESVIRSNNIDIAAITESWLHESIPSEILSISNYICYRHDRSDGRRGGGVCCFVRSGLQCSRLDILESPDVEALWLLYRANRMPRSVSHIAVGIYYHPPDANEFQLADHIIKSADYVTRTHPYSGIIILGDFNNFPDRYIISYPLKQVVHSATRNKRVLDKIYTNIHEWYQSPSSLPPIAQSDHNCVLFTPEDKEEINNKPHTTIKVVRSHDKNGKIFLAHALKNMNWSNLYRLNDPNEMMMYFYEIIDKLLNAYLPLQCIQIHSNDKPWINEDFRQHIRRRQFAWSSGNLAVYRQLRNKIQRMAKELKTKFYNRCIRDLRNSDPKKWWSNIKKITGHSSSTSSSSSLATIANNICNNEMHILAETINNHLYSVSSDLDPLHPDDHMFFNSLIDDYSSTYIIDPSTVQRKLEHIDVYKSSGPDNVPNWFLRDFSIWLAEPICAIFNASVRTGIVPSSWKKANVVPIPKVNPPLKIEYDLRPISLTPTISKLLESIVGQWILESTWDHLDKYQFGGIKGRSATHALVDMLHHWHQALDESKYVRVLFIDYAKAFDHVDHTIFIDKLLNVLHAPHFIIKWIHSFLTNRVQRVKIGDIVSSWIPLVGGLPQGSWLAPLVFILFINDLKSENTLLHKYIDDLTLSEIFSRDTMSDMNNLLAHILNWSENQHLNINGKKTKIMSIGSLRNNPPDPVFIQGKEIEAVRTFKLLGVHIQDNLKFDEHISKICAKATVRIHFMKQLKRGNVQIEDMLHYYYATIRPILEYACPAWNTSLTSKEIDKLEQVQKRALSIIFDLPVYECYNQFCNDNSIETLFYRRMILCRSFFERSVLNTNGSLHYLFPPLRPELSYNLRKKCPIIIPTPHSAHFQNSYIMSSLNDYVLS